MKGGTEPFQKSLSRRFCSSIQEILLVHARDFSLTRPSILAVRPPLQLFPLPAPSPSTDPRWKQGFLESTRGVLTLQLLHFPSPSPSPTKPTDTSLCPAPLPGCLTLRNSSFPPHPGLCSPPPFGIWISSFYHQDFSPRQGQGNTWNLNKA